MHLRHYYYFEKYLRNEMQAGERVLFEDRLQTDTEFAEDFAEYKEHRQEIVQQELAEYEEPILEDKSSNFGKWIILSITILSIVLLIDFIIHRPYSKTSPTEDIAHYSFFDRFNLFKKLNNKLNHSSSNPISNKENGKDELIDSNHIALNLFDSTTQIIDTSDLEYLVSSDVKLADTSIFIVDMEDFKEKHLVANLNRDSSMLGDSIHKFTIAKKSDKSKLKKEVKVEFWNSPAKYKGYRFSGKELVVFGINKPEELYLIKNQETYILHIESEDKVVLKDNYFHEW